jgi:membrane-associated phospholipid phosphatase
MRRALAVALFAAISAAAAAVAGVPDRPYVLVWMVLLAALACRDNPRPWARVIWDWLPVLVITAGYDLVRSFAPDLATRAVTAPQRDFDEALFGGTAPTVTLQRALVDGASPHWWDYAAWLVYLTHFVVTPAVAIWLYLRHRRWFGRYAMLILTISLAAFMTYVLLPAVPPWMASQDGALQHVVRVVHSVWTNLGFDSAAKVFAGRSHYANPVAALPSLHAAWPFLTLLYLWNRLPRSRSPLVAYNAVMILVLVYGAEHYVSDILLGWVYATVVLVVSNRLLDGRARRSDAARSRERQPPDAASATASSSTAS